MKAQELTDPKAVRTFKLKFHEFPLDTLQLSVKEKCLVISEMAIKMKMKEDSIYLFIYISMFYSFYNCHMSSILTMCFQALKKQITNFYGKLLLHVD
jgi:hypothetical protein